MTTPSNYALQRTRRERRGYNRCVPCAGSLSLGRCAAARGVTGSETKEYNALLEIQRALSERIRYSV